jgi:hypothetical protein
MACRRSHEGSSDEEGLLITKPATLSRSLGLAAASSKRSFSSPCQEEVLGFFFRPDRSRNDPAKWRKQMLILLAGPAAEERFDGTTEGWVNDYARASVYARAVNPDDWEEVFKSVSREAITFVRDNWKTIAAVARVLIRKGTISGEHELLARS